MCTRRRPACAAVAARPILGKLPGDLAEGAHVRSPLQVDCGTYINVGKGTFIKCNRTALGVGPITIGESSVIGAGAVVTRDVPPNVVQCSSGTSTRKLPRCSIR